MKKQTIQKRLLQLATWQKGKSIKITLLLFFAVFLFRTPTMLKAQTICEVVETENSEGFTFNSNNSLQCPGASIDFGDYDIMAPITIYVNVHFGPSPNGDNFDPATAASLANELVNTANFYLNNMEQNEKPGPSGGLSPHIKKAKWQLKYIQRTCREMTLEVFGLNLIQIQECITLKS